MRIISHKEIIIKNKFLDTNLLWIEISIVLGVIAITFHILAEFLGLYDVTNIDVYTHFMSSFALISLLLNLNLTRSRKIYWGLPIVMAFILGLIWEASEEVFIISGLFPWIQNEFWNAIQDLFMDILGGIVAGFFVDKVVE
jgi:hypothetical protein